MKPINPAILDKLLQLAKKAASYAYAPYSKFKVGAALITENEHYFSGCNVENASYGLALCAERNALSTMIAQGEKTFMALVVYSPNTANCYPCGACRQWLQEFGPDATIIVFDDNHKPVLKSVKDLLPDAFGPEKLL